MKTILLLAILSGSVLFADTCAPGTLQTYISLAPGGCTLEGVTFDGFTLESGQSFATPIDPSSVEVTPGGSSFLPALKFTLNQSAAAGDLFESFFRFNATAPTLVGGGMLLGPASATGDGAVTATEDICPGGLFAGDTPTGCGNPAATLITFAAEFSSSLSDSAAFPVTSFFDIFVDLTVDGGPSGSARLSSATVTINAVPEPGSTVLMMTALGALAMLRIRRSL